MPANAKSLRDARLRRDLFVAERTAKNAHFLPRAHPSATDPADAETADIARIIERGDLELQRRFGVARRWRHVREDRLEQRPHVGAFRRCVLPSRP
jgi:hypothetical protein